VERGRPIVVQPRPFRIYPFRICGPRDIGQPGRDSLIHWRWWPPVATKRLYDCDFISGFFSLNGRSG